MSLLDDSMKNRLKKAANQQQSGQAQSQPHELDLDEFYRIRAKMLGVLIRDARLSAARTEEDCARIMGVTVDEYVAWEYGDQSPSLPQLELLAFYLGVPVSQFWSQNTLQEEYTEDSRTEEEYVKLRTRMIGVMLRTAREEAGLSVAELAEEAGLSAEVVQEYEMGGQPIPMHELNVMARAVQKNMTYFLESSGQIGELLAMREEWKHFTDLPDDLRQFAANPVNIGFIEIALMLSKMPTEKLRSVGRSIVEITM